MSFSKGDAIDLRDVSNEKLYKKLAATDIRLVIH